MLTLQACLNGARTTGDHTAVPTTPTAIASDAAAIAGLVAGVHVHAKGSDGTDSLAAAHVDATVAAIRAAAPSLEVGVTTGAWASPDPADRVAAIRAWTVLPDVASVNWHEPGADDVAAALLDRGIGIEAGVWHAEGLGAWRRSPHRDRVVRVLVEVQPMGADPAIATATALVEGVRDASPVPILLHGEDASAWPVLRLAASLGLASRMGLEDALALDDGTLAAGNGAIVRRAAALVGRA